MIAWIFGVPAILMAMVMGLSKLEARVVAPAERVGRIRRLIEAAPADEVERAVTVLLQPVVERSAKAS